MDRLQEATARGFPDRQVAEITPQTTRPGNTVGLVTFADGGTAYVKTATDTDRRLNREIAATRFAAAHCPIEVPEILGAATDCSPSYLAMAPLPGTPLNELWTEGHDRAPLVRQAGRIIAGVHEAEFETPGRILGGDATSLELTAESWTETLCKTIEWRAEDWFADRFEELPDRLVETLREAAPVLDDVEARLLHADCSRINAHLNPNGLLDWERALVGDPALDLVDTYGHLIDQVDVDDAEREPLEEALYDGYRERAGCLPSAFERRKPLYRAVSHLLVPQTFEEWAPTVDTPDAELAAQVRSEFDSRLADARQVIP